MQILFWYIYKERAHIPTDPRAPIPSQSAAMITKHVISMIALVFGGALQTICSLSDIHHALSLPPPPSQHLILVQSPCSPEPSNAHPSQAHDHDYKTWYRYVFLVFGRPPNYLFIVRNPSRALHPPPMQNLIWVQSPSSSRPSNAHPLTNARPWLQNMS